MKRMKDFMKLHKKSVIITSIILCTVILLGITVTIATASTLNHNKIYEGVLIDDLDVSNLTVEEASAKVLEHFTEALDYAILLKYENVEKEINLSDLLAEIDVKATVQNAYKVGRDGSIIDRLKMVYDIKKNTLVINPLILCDDALLESYFKEIADQFDHAGQEMQLAVTDSELVITRGIPGSYIDIFDAMQKFKESAYRLKNGNFILEAKELIPAEPNAKDIHDKISGDPVDASYKIENHRLIIIDDKPGVSFDIDAVQSVIDQTPGDVITVPVTVTQANITTEKLQAQLFPDLLGTYSTRYNAGDVSRSHNVSLASQKINEVVLAPGEVFSYNDIVGPRTVARGFKIANVYVGNKVEPGIGGGICQVSSTLFNAVVLSDLDIVFRTNHSLPVTYVPLGRDATVSYGSIDFKFKNSTNHPIKIVASASGGTNKISIYGVKENKARTIEITTEFTGSYASRVVQKEDPTLPVGTVKVEQNGSAGSSYNTYKVTKENGSVVKTELLTKSKYVASDCIEIVGTMPVEDPEAQPQETNAPPVDAPQATQEPSPVIPPDAGSDPSIVPTSAPKPTIPPIEIGAPNAQ